MRRENLQIGDYIQGDQNRIGKINRIDNFIGYSSSRGSWFLNFYDISKIRHLTEDEIKEYKISEERKIYIETLRDILDNRILKDNNG